jgi:hypothetical protein
MVPRAPALLSVRSELPVVVIEACEAKVGNPDWVSSSDIVPIGKAARDLTLRLAEFLAATGRRLRTLGKVISHFFATVSGLKLAMKIPFFIEIEVCFETDWNRRR